MAFKKLEYEKDWRNASDFPTYQPDETAVREDMQYHPDAVMRYINSVLLFALEGKTAAKELGAADADGNKSTIQSVLDAHMGELNQIKDDMEVLANGGVPSVVMTTPVTFTAGSWVSSSGEYRLTIAKADHKRENGNFGYRLYHKVGNYYRGGTWATESTVVIYGSNGSITLYAPEAYEGKIVFFGL